MIFKLSPRILKVNENCCRSSSSEATVPNRSSSVPGQWESKLRIQLAQLQPGTRKGLAIQSLHDSFLNCICRNINLTEFDLISEFIIKILGQGEQVERRQRKGRPPFLVRWCEDLSLMELYDCMARPFLELSQLNSQLQSAGLETKPMLETKFGLWRYYSSSLSSS